jgi:4-hydroxy-2-oxoheptanedioate aldolase
VWPLDPDGELLLLGIVENVRGINALPDILRQVKGLSAIWAGPMEKSGVYSIRRFSLKGQHTPLRHAV